MQLPLPWPAAAAAASRRQLAKTPLHTTSILSPQDELWRVQCERTLTAQRSPSNGLDGVSAPQALQALRLPTYRRLFEALQGLGAWPAGLWCATNDAALPRGRLLMGQLDSPAGSLHLQQLRARVLHGAADPGDAWELPPGNSIRAEVPEGGTQARLAVDSADRGLHCALQVALDGQSLVVHRSQEPRLPQPLPGFRTLPPVAATDGSGSSGSSRGGGSSSSRASQALASLTRYLGAASMRVQLESIHYRRVVLPSPADLEAVEGEPPGMALLRSVQACYQGSYGCVADGPAVRLGCTRLDCRGRWLPAAA